MKVRILLFLVIYLCISGCSDEGIMLSEQVIESGLLEDGVVTDIPPEVWEILKYVREERVRWYERALQSSNIWQDDLDAAVIRAEQIKAAQETFYTKYIDAGGIAIVGNAEVANKHLLEARRVVLTMTLKYPVLRERLLSRYGRYYLILIQPTQEEMNRWSFSLPEHNGGSTWPGCHTSTYWKLESVMGYCYAPVIGNPDALRTFVHEFAHALESEIDLLQPGLKDRAWLESGIHLPLNEALKKNPGFRDRLEHAYNTAYARGTWEGEYANVNYGEYWAEGAEMWFYDIGERRRFETYEAFSERDPLLAELLSEWFPAVALPRYY